MKDLNKMNLNGLKILSRKELKNVIAGSGTEIGVSCECKDGHSAGMASCVTCERYCSKDNSYGGENVCS